MESMFNSYEAQNQKGVDISNAFDRLVKPFIQNLVGQGYSTVELESVLGGVVTLSIYEARLIKAMKRHEIEVKEAKETTETKTTCTLRILPNPSFN